MNKISFPLKIHYKEETYIKPARGFILKKNKDSITFKLYNPNTKKVIEKTIKNQNIISIYNRKTGKKV